MKIQQIQNYNTNFQGLHVVDKKIYRQLHCENCGNIFFPNPEIKECAEKFEVLVKRGKPIPKMEKDAAFTKMLEIFLGSSIGLSIGMAGTLVANTAGMLVTASEMLVAGTIGTVLGLLGTVGLIHKKEQGNDYEYELQVGKRIKETPLGRKELVEPLSRKYSIRKYSDIIDIRNIAKQAEQRIQQNFTDLMEKFDVDNLFEPKKILKILKDKEVKANYLIEELFNNKLDEEKSDTLLTKFFDIVPTEDNQQDYDKIIEILKNADNIDYNQVDSNGISIVEKIINSENTKALELVRDFEFNYTKGMDLAYDNIENEKFKRKVKRLNVTFPNIREAAKINSNRALNAILPEFASPFCDVAKVMNDIFGTIDLGSYYSTLAFLEKNGVDTSSVKIQKTWDD